MIELETHIETLSRLLVTLQQDNEMLLSVNIYITMYDVIRTAEQDREAVEHTSLPVIADMKKTVRRAWSEAGIRLNGMDFSQIDCFIGSQISGYDPLYKDGHGIPSNTVAAMYPWIYARVSDEGGIRLGSNDGVPVFIDFFRRDSERVNSNMVIIGKSGSGKSYATKSILSNLAADDAKIFILDPENEYTELAHNLHGKFVVFHTGTGEYRQFLPSDKCCQTINRGNTGVNVISRVHSCHRIDWLTVYICLLFGVNVTQTVNRSAESVKHSA